MNGLRWRHQCLFWVVICSFGCLIFAFHVFEISEYSYKPALFTQLNIKPTVSPEDDTNQQGYLIRTAGCSIPAMDPMDESIRKFVFDEEEIVCNNGVPPLMDSNGTSIFFLESSFEQYGINSTDDLKCCYRSFARADPVEEKRDDGVTFDDKCYEFTESIKIKDEFIRVSCENKTAEIYKDFFNFVPLRNKTALPNDDILNVLMIGLDAVSRLNFLRQMPQTVNLLEDLDAIDMLGYNKVGDNTFPNLVPVFTGMSEDELKEACWPNSSDHFDACPFIWRSYKQRGYTTVFAEDAAWMGLFYFTRRGFKLQPTDYFWDQFEIAAERQIGNAHRLNVEQCIGARPTHKVLLEYMSKFVEAMQANNKPYFGFFWQASLTHDFLNKAKLGDQDYYDLIYALNVSNALNNTALIFLSDHGMRWGDIRSTYQGRMEERLPFLYIVLPTWFKEGNSFLISNLKVNERRLTTPYDLHETLKDLLNWRSLHDNKDYKSKVKDKQNVTRGFSLFDYIPDDRTCAHAGISSHWCTCQLSKSVQEDEEVVVEAANYTVQYINKLLEGYADCMELKLENVKNARLQVNTEELMKDHSAEDYTITFQTTPGGALFESTVRKTNDKEGNYYFNVTGTVSRINLYGQQSLCITDFHLKLYCFCRQFFKVTD